MQERINLLGEAHGMLAFLFTPDDRIEFEADALPKPNAVDEARLVLDAAEAALSPLTRLERIGTITVNVEAVGVGHGGAHCVGARRGSMHRLDGRRRAAAHRVSIEEVVRFIVNRRLYTAEYSTSHLWMCSVIHISQSILCTNDGA